jgi:formylglycine-generating enzyme required for sulfatase activity
MSAPAFWPNADDYRQAIQNLRDTVEDEELRAGQPSLNARHKALLWAGGFSSVFRIECPATGKSWALKCFTREVIARRERYRHIAAALEAARLPFTVPFVYLERGIQVRGRWFAAVKMEWVEGQPLNRFVEASLEKPHVLQQLLDLWPRLAARLREARIAHADLQHGNVLLVPAPDGKLALKLIDYDGMFIPSLADTPSGEAGHPNYQHPARLLQGVYNLHVDRFSHLLIFSAVQCLVAGNRDLWKRFNNDENLLFRQRDFQDPGQSQLFRDLWATNDPSLRRLVGRLALACKQPLEEVPWVDQVVEDGQVKALTPAEQQAAESLMDAGNLASRPPLPASGTAAAEDDFSFNLVANETTPTQTRPMLNEGTVAAPPPPVSCSRAGASSLRERSSAAVRGLDGFFRRLVGRENRFLWVAVPLLLLAAVWAGIWAWTHRPAPSKLRPAASQIVETGNDLKSQIVIDLGGGKHLAMILVPAGEFMMGSPNSDDNAERDEKPQHPVRITRPFYLGKYPVTQEQWQAVMGNNPSRFNGPKSPVQNVSWDDCQQFLKKLNAKIGAQGGKLVLPTEAQWEYACRAGSTTRYCFGDHDSGLDEYAWYAANSGKTTRPVGLKKPNVWGLYDMHGDVEEWCADRYDGSYYGKSPTDDPTGPATGSDRVDRGGSSESPADRCRSAARGARRPGDRSDNLGFRIAQVPADAAAGTAVASPSAASKSNPIESKTTESKTTQAKAIESGNLLKVPAPVTSTFDLGKGVTLEMVRIPAGEFLMGSPASDQHVPNSEKPLHRVRITRPFFLSTYLVTQEQWQAVTGSNPSYFKGAKNPVEHVKWNDCQAFLNELNRQIGGQGRKFALPNEAQWEYASRAGSTTPYSFGSADSELGEYAWYQANSGGQTHPVGQKRANAWGLYDMYGDVREWCQDWYAANYYAKSPTDDPTGPATGSYRVERNGSWDSPAGRCRSAARGFNKPESCSYGLGFRVCLVAGEAVVPGRHGPSSPRR